METKMKFESSQK